MASFTRRFVSVLSGSALAFSLVSVPAAVVATAAAQAECSTSGSGNWSGYTVTSSWLDSTAAPGGQATLRSTITGPGGVVGEAWQYHPEGFVPESSRVRSYKFPTGQSWADETIVRDAGNNAARPSGSGWTTASQSVTVDITYRVPEDAVPGSVLNSGSKVRITAVGTGDFNPIGACLTIRGKNPVESVQGSLQGIGAGSLVDGSVASANMSSDPSGSIADVINDLDLGQLIGGAMGS
ncbi:MAG TPA: hypothetical protein H9755_03170 [Candidatus Dietzia intestinigallinarum]|nr:hypothetical protein [Candidatus Dietzia intestinigallinarum]